MAAVGSKTYEQRSVPYGNQALVAILPAEDVGKTHIAVVTLGIEYNLLKESAVGAIYLSKRYLERCSFCALRVHSTAVYKPLCGARYSDCCV